MKRTTIFYRAIALATLSFALLSLTACNNGKKDASYRPSSSPRMSKTAVSGIALNSFAEAYDMEMTESVAPTAANYERKIARTGHMSVEVTDLSEAQQQVEKLVSTCGGWISDSSQYERDYYATIKVPADQFDQLMNATGEYGRVLSKSVNSNDITDSWYDTETRIETKRTLQEKLQSYLSEAKNMSDLLEIERQLNAVTSELEVMEGQMKRMENQVAYSTLNLSFSLPAEIDDDSFWYDISYNFKTFVPQFLRFLAWCGLGMLYLIVFGVPIIAIIALLYWLLLGKVGLLRNLFKKLSK